MFAAVAVGLEYSTTNKPHSKHNGCNQIQTHYSGMTRLCTLNSYTIIQTEAKILFKSFIFLLKQCNNI